MKIYIYSIIALCIIAFSSCDDLFSPANENNRSKEEIYDEPGFAQGILLNGYTRIPTGSWSFNDVATDNAVSNDKNNNYLKAVTGQWRSNFNPFDQWQNSKAAIQYLNIILAESDKVKWAIDENVSSMFNDRMKGEAYGLRALFMFHMLQAHGGWSESGELLGVPIILDPESPTSDFNQPRASFEDCLQQIYSDLDAAEELLPLDYEDIKNDSEIPSKYAGTGIDKDDYNRVFGEHLRQRITKRICMGIRSKATLLAASPAYSEGTTATWENAANHAADVLDLIGGIDGIDPNGLTWYANGSEIDNLAKGVNPKEILWRGGVSNSNSLETDHYPPSLYGKGRLNPTQNLVDAFPMLDGYPYSSSETPYENRDPRLQKYIVVNGSKAGPSDKVIKTEVDANNNDGIGTAETSTRTGYYLRKLLRKEVNLDPVTKNEQKHYTPHIRYTEIFLIYAEAANEAWGPQSRGGRNYSAYDVIKAIRKRAGIGLSNGDAYLESIKTDKEKMRELIRNERRLELCFEGFRFWDLRRWNENLTEAASGVRISNGKYTKVTVENRNYQAYMNYGPIPYSELLKFDALVQNKGW